MIIYKITNSINGKIYIGQDSKNNPDYYGSGTYLKRAINKYGKENFKKEIIEDNISNKQILNEREIYWIGKLDSRNPEIGYNLTIGGEGTNGYIFTKEDKEKISNAVSGENNGMFGKHHTEKTRKKISKIRIERELSKGKNNPSCFMSKEKLLERGKKQRKSLILSGKVRGKYNGMFGKHQTKSAKRKNSIWHKKHCSNIKIRKEMSERVKQYWKNLPEEIKRERIEKRVKTMQAKRSAIKYYNLKGGVYGTRYVSTKNIE